MPASRHKRRRHVDEETLRVSQRSTAGLLAQRTLELPATPLPQVQLKASGMGPFIYKKMLDHADPVAQPGDLVAVLDKHGQGLGYGLFNPRSEIVVRMLSRGEASPGAAWWEQRLGQAVSMRQDLLRLREVSDAYRLIHAEADGLTGLVVDRFGDVLSAQAFSLGIFQRGQQLLERLLAITGAKHGMMSVDAQVHGQEGFLADALKTADFPPQVTIHEQGIRYRVDFQSGHKTGFFCDQRENRLKLAGLCAGKSMLDLCCYTGGFAISAHKLGQAAEITAVDLDEQALAVAKENARLNRAKVHFVHADAFGYMRDMIANGRRYEVVVLDPPKLIRSRWELEEGTRKTFDMNRLAMQLVAPGGLLLSCSCSGLLTEEAFFRLLFSAARQSLPANGMVQLLAKTGAAADHPVGLHCPETEYLRAAWLRLG